MNQSQTRSSDAVDISTIPQDRWFNVWAYTTSLKRLLLRSIRHLDGSLASSNVDIRFLGVAYMDLPTYLGQLNIVAPEEGEATYVLDRLGRDMAPGETLCVVKTGDRRHFVVAAGWRVEENHLERLDAGFWFDDGAPR